MAYKFIDADDIELRIRQRADMVGSAFISDSEVTEIAKNAFQEFWMRIVAQYEDLCVRMTPATIALTSSTTLASLPNDMLKLKGLRILDEDFLVPVSSVLEIEKFTRNGRRGKPVAYWMAGIDTVSAVPAKFMPLPLPSASYTVECYYVPNITLTGIDSDAEAASKMSLIAGADEYIVLAGAIKAKDKEESDCTVLMNEKKLLWEVIEKSLTPLDESHPKRVVQHAGRFAGGAFGDPFGAEEFFG